MHILSWNLNGLKSCLRRNDFAQLQELPVLDVVCLQEIRTPDRPMVLEGYHHYWNTSEKKNYSGTLILTLVEAENVIRGIGVPELDKEGRVITVDLGSVYVVNTYTPNSQHGVEREEYRREWDAAYRRFLAGLAEQKPVIACGDFNVTLSRIDVYDENERADWTEQGYLSDERANLRELLEDGFTDAYRYLYPEEKGAFTWWSNRLCKRNEDRGWRLDYFLLSDCIREQVRDVVHCREITGSDHCPILLDCMIEDAEYSEKYDKAAGERKKKADEDERLSQMWSKRKKDFKKYREKLSELQMNITVVSKLHYNNSVRRLQTEILDDIRFRCLAVDKVASAGAPSGVDNVKWRTNADKMRAALALDWRTYKALPKRIIEIKAKNTGKIRRTGILTYRDKAMSILCMYIFAPIEEAYADRASFAFRPARSWQDAIIAVEHLFIGKNAPEMYVRTDVKGCYSALQHKWIMQHVPLPKNILRTLLKAGHIFDGELFESGKAGISEGSPLSPMIANFTLDGIQRVIYKSLYGSSGGDAVDYADGAMVRFADDIIASVRTEKEAETVLSAVREFLKPRGLVLSEEKTKTGMIRDGLEFIGFEVKKTDYDEVVVHPRQTSVERYKCDVHDLIVNFCGSQRGLIQKVNRKLTGWAGQYRCCDAYDSYREIDVVVKESLLEAAIAHHPRMQLPKLIARYWYTDEAGRMWYALPDDRSVKVIHLADTLLITPKRNRTDINPFFQGSYFIEKKKADDIGRINAKYRPAWEKFGGNCMYCGRPLLADQDKQFVLIDHRKADTICNRAYVHTICVQSDYQFLTTVEDVDGITDYDVYDMLQRISQCGTVIRDKGLPEDWKFLRLYEYFGGCSKPRVLLTFREMEDILGFPLSEGMKTKRSRWSPRKGTHTIADAWILQGYKLDRIYFSKQKALFKAMFEDAERVVIPAEISDRKVPAAAKHEIEHFLKAMVKKYALSDDDLIPYRQEK